MNALAFLPDPSRLGDLLNATSAEPDAPLSGVTVAMRSALTDMLANGGAAYFERQGSSGIYRPRCSRGAPLGGAGHEHKRKTIMALLARDFVELVEIDVAGKRSRQARLTKNGKWYARTILRGAVRAAAEIIQKSNQQQGMSNQ